MVGPRTWWELWLLFTVGALLESVWRVARARDGANAQLEKNRRNQELSDLLVLQHDGMNQPIHVVWGIPAGKDSPAVVVTAYRPDPTKWDETWQRRRT